MLRIYGIDIDGSVRAADIAEMTEQEKIDLVEKHKDNGEVYTLEGWFNYLNADKIDIKNKYWIPLNY